MIVQELTFIIKQDIANINGQIASLQAFVKSQGQSKGGTQKQVEEHNNNVVMLLQSKLANTSMNFKDVLEIRTQVALIDEIVLALLTTCVEYEGVEGSHGAFYVFDSCRG